MFVFIVYFFKYDLFYISAIVLLFTSLNLCSLVIFHISLHATSNPFEIRQELSIHWQFGLSSIDWCGRVPLWTIFNSDSYCAFSQLTHPGLFCTNLYGSQSLPFCFCVADFSNPDENFLSVCSKYLGDCYGHEYSSYTLFICNSSRMPL